MTEREKGEEKGKGVGWGRREADLHGRERGRMDSGRRLGSRSARGRAGGQRKYGTVGRGCAGVPGTI